MGQVEHRKRKLHDLDVRESFRGHELQRTSKRKFVECRSRVPTQWRAHTLCSRPTLEPTLHYDFLVTQKQSETRQNALELERKKSATQTLVAFKSGPD